MSLKKHHKQMVYVLIMVAAILFFIGLVVLFASLGTNYQEEATGERVIIYLLTFGLAALTFGVAVWRLKMAYEEYPVPALTETEENLLTTRRMMLISGVNLRTPYSFYSLNGKEIGIVEEQKTSIQQIFHFLFLMIGLAPILPMHIRLMTSEKTIHITKQGGWNKGYNIYDEQGRLISYFQPDNKVWKRMTIGIFSPEGEKVADLKDNGSGDSFTVAKEDGTRLLFMRIGGVPVEAMELFGTVEGDIIDIDREYVTPMLFLQIIPAPIIIKFLLRR